MANDNFYGYKRKDKKRAKGLDYKGVDMEFESVNPYEFKKGMYCELKKLGTTLRESESEQREKATETVLNNLKEHGGYYSNLIHYETHFRNTDKKPTFKQWLSEQGENNMI